MLIVNCDQLTYLHHYTSVTFTIKLVFGYLIALFYMTTLIQLTFISRCQPHYSDMDKGFKYGKIGHGLKIEEKWHTSTRLTVLINLLVLLEQDGSLPNTAKNEYLDQIRFLLYSVCILMVGEC